MMERSEAKAGQSGNIALLIVIIAVLLVAGGLYFLKGNGLAMISQNQSTPAAESVTLYDLGEIVTNLSEVGEEKYIRTKVSVELSNKLLEKEVSSKQPILRDTLINLFNNKNGREINNNRDKLKQEALTELNRHLSTGRITNIYFYDLIMQ